MSAEESEVVSPLIVDTAPDTSGTAAASLAAAVSAAAAAARTGSQAQVSKAALAAKLMSLSGVFAVHKPKGPTSAELLNRLKEKLLAGTRPGRDQAKAFSAAGLAPWDFLSLFFLFNFLT